MSGAGGAEWELAEDIARLPKATRPEPSKCRRWGDRRVKALADSQVLAQHVAEWMTGLARAVQGVFPVSLSGGSTPKGAQHTAASDSFSDRFPRSGVVWYWGDERFGPLMPQRVMPQRVTSRSCNSPAAALRSIRRAPVRHHPG